MSSRSLQLTDSVYEYLLRHSLRENEHCVALREETLSLAAAGMQISPEQGQFMSLLIEIIGAQKAIEVGVFTGYSALCVALALPKEGQLIACDVSEPWTSIGRKYWAAAGVRDKIDLRLAPALETLHLLLDEGGAGNYDFAFVDADKENYPAYYELCFQLLRPGGLLLIDNVLWGGSVADPTDQEADTRSIRQLNQLVHHDSRVQTSMLPVGDGLTIVRKR